MQAVVVETQREPEKNISGDVFSFSLPSFSFSLPFSLYLHLIGTITYHRQTNTEHDKPQIKQTHNTRLIICKSFTFSLTLPLPLSLSLSLPLSLSLSQSLSLWYYNIPQIDTKHNQPQTKQTHDTTCYLVICKSFTISHFFLSLSLFLSLTFPISYSPSIYTGCLKKMQPF